MQKQQLYYRKCGAFISPMNWRDFPLSILKGVVLMINQENNIQFLHEDIEKIR
jgi:hypothetical protein